MVLVTKSIEKIIKNNYFRAIIAGSVSGLTFFTLMKEEKKLRDLNYKDANKKITSK